MVNYKEIIRLYSLGISQNQISKSVHSSRNTIRSIITKIQTNDYSVPELSSMNNEELSKLFEKGNMKKKKVPDQLYVMPDYEQLVDELKKPGVTQQLLWEEYSYQCRKNNQIPYKITQFKKYFKEYLSKKGFTDIIQHKPGYSVEVDWNGKQASWKDPDTGEIIKGWMFVGVLSYSGYIYAEVFSDMRTENWINAHIHMFHYFGGLPKVIIPDNLKTGVIKHPKNEEPILNPIYNDMAEYYGLVIIPTRVRHPKDKPLAENAVNQCTRQIMARIRDYQFFSVDEYNKQLLIELEKLNRKRFQKKPGSRYTRFIENEKGLLSPLPSFDYEYAEWKKAKVASNSHISYEKKYYSVPHEYIGCEVDLKITKKEISIYYEQTLLYVHPHIYGRDGQYNTNPEHMPPNSNAYQEWNKDRFIKWANKIGVHTTDVILNLFAHVQYEQQGYNGAKSILLLGGKYGNERLENACRLALENITNPRYKHVKAILENKQDQINNDDEKHDNKNNEKENLRGRDYYKRGQDQWK